MNARLVPLLAILLFLASCGSPQSAEPAPSARARPSPSARPSSGPRNSPSPTATPQPPPPTSAVTPTPNLVPGSNPSALPGPVLIADHLNNRLLIVDPAGDIIWQFPQSGDLAAGQTFWVPDDAFFTPDGKYIVATQEDDFVISLIDIATRRIVWQYGTPGRPGSGPNQLWNPDDAIMMPNGDVILADIKNCRILVLQPPAASPLQVLGETRNDCQHAPPARWGSPNGAFPMTDGHYLITEINGSWVDEVGLDGQVYWSTHPPGESYPSDTNEVSPGVFLSTSYTDPGVIEEFDQTGTLRWRYQPPAGNPPLNKPSLALPLPNGDILANDDFNHRVIVIDPRTNQIVWQYGHTGVAGSAPGYLNDPDGVDLAPPYSLARSHAPSMGVAAGSGGGLPGGLYGPGALVQPPPGWRP
ncbi:MAG: hypothetical protein WAM30_01775 [Candidatus Dormiibacterota bacterium]